MVPNFTIQNFDLLSAIPAGPKSHSEISRFHFGTDLLKALQISLATKFLQKLKHVQLIDYAHSSKTQSEPFAVLSLKNPDLPDRFIQVSIQFIKRILSTRQML